jgi:putative addiction module component (TIGR02574 family)
MVATPKELYERAMSLSDEERAELVGMLLESLDMIEEEGVAAAWLAEIERRVADLNSGSVDPVSWTEVRSRVFEPGGS